MELSKPRKLLQRFEVEGDVRFLTFSCVHRLPLLDQAAYRDLLSQQIHHVRNWFEFELFAWVIMPEHVHLMLRPPLPNATVSQILSAIKRPVARRLLSDLRTNSSPTSKIARNAGAAHVFWQPGGGYDRNIRSPAAFSEKVNYIDTNPVKRGLVARAQDWAWSSARGRMKLDSRWPVCDEIS